MVRYVIKRVLLLIPVIIAVSFIVFALIELMPGTIVDQLIAGDMTQEDIAALRALYNLDKSMFYRYGLYMFNLIRGDLGVSMLSGMSVFETYMQRLPNTLLLTFSAAIIGIAIAIPMGIRAAKRAGTLTDTATTTFTLMGMSMPSFWLGLLLMLLFALRLKWLPAGGNREGVRSLILPAICCAMSLTAQCTRQTRSSMLEVLKADYLKTARAKGAPEDRVIRKHALGNALIPIITTIGGQLCVQLAGSAVIEHVFAWPGVGKMLVEGVNSRDVPVILGCTIMTTIMYVLVMLIVDLLYAFVDPRIKSQYTRKNQKRQSTATALAEADNLADMPAAEAPDAVYGIPAGTGEAIYGKGGVALSQTHIAALGTNKNDQPNDISSTEAIESSTSDYVTREHKDIVTGDMPDDVSEVMTKYKKRSQIGEIIHRLARNKSSLAGIIILGFLIIMAIVSLTMSFETVTASNMPAKFSAPSWRFPFGTDNLGRNAFLRVIYGTRYSIVIGFGSMLFSAIFGVTLGSVAGYFGGRVDNVIMRISDVLASIPGLMLGMVIMIVLGRSLPNLIVAVGMSGITHFIRMSRASILTVKDNEFVEASRAVGFSNLRIITTQVLPNGISPIIVQATMTLGFAIMISASLSFLGFGVPPPIPEWGTLVSAGREYARTSPWLMAFPGGAIMLIVLGFNLLGDGLRDALDPKLKK